MLFVKNELLFRVKLVSVASQFPVAILNPSSVDLLFRVNKLFLYKVICTIESSFAFVSHMD